MLLEEMFQGNFHPADLTSPKTHDYRALNQEIIEKTSLRNSRLTPKNRDLLDDLISNIYTVSCMELEQCFSLSFSAGLILQQEATEQVEVVL